MGGSFLGFGVKDWSVPLYRFVGGGSTEMDLIIIILCDVSGGFGLAGGNYEIIGKNK